ncbi:T9SS type A sorting domain-containing protein, partial [bacterium]|nr:T9SS type A sorting domain-containing protein [bacterium]
ALGLHDAPAIAGRFQAVFVDSLGGASKERKTNLVICNDPDELRNTDIAYSEQDHEYLVVWGDRRNWETAFEDIYGLRVAIQTDSSVLYLNADSQPLVPSGGGFPLETGIEFEGCWRIIGCAHSLKKNEFFAAYTFDVHPDSLHLSDIRGVRLGGTSPSGIRQESGLPLGFGLYPNQPNPFNPETRILYSVPAPGEVTLEIFDVRGRLMQTLVRSALSAGNHEAVWNGLDASGHPAASGLYIAVLRQGDSATAGKMMLAR